MSLKKLKIQNNYNSYLILYVKTKNNVITDFIKVYYYVIFYIYSNS